MIRKVWLKLAAPLCALPMLALTTPAFAQTVLSKEPTPVVASNIGSSPQGLVGPSCTGNWYSYDVVVPAYGIGTALTGPEYSDLHTDVNVGVSAMNSSYNNRVYAQATNKAGDQITSYVPIAEYSSYDLWYNQSGGQDVRVGFATEFDVTVNIEVQGQWSPNTDC